jgi:hypothetical protein
VLLALPRRPESPLLKKLLQGSIYLAREEFFLGKRGLLGKAFLRGKAYDVFPH